MSINIYDKYIITFHSEGAYISQEYSTPNDISFQHFDNTQKLIWDGGRLLDFIQKRLSDNDIQELFVYRNTNELGYNAIIYKFEFFNPNNGEAHTLTMLIQTYTKMKEGEENVK